MNFPRFKKLVLGSVFNLPREKRKKWHFLQLQIAQEKSNWAVVFNALRFIEKYRWEVVLPSKDSKRSTLISFNFPKAQEKLSGQLFQKNQALNFRLFLKISRLKKNTIVKFFRVPNTHVKILWPVDRSFQTLKVLGSSLNFPRLKKGSQLSKLPKTRVKKSWTSI